MESTNLETSFISACVSTRTTSRAVYEREMSLAWLATRASQHRMVLADPVIAELSSPIYPLRDSALAFAAQFEVAGVTPAMELLAAAFVERLVMPRNAQGDALHVAAAVILGVDTLLTWNVKHLANERKQPHLRAICLEFGLKLPRLTRPDVLLLEEEP